MLLLVIFVSCKNEKEEQVTGNIKKQNREEQVFQSVSSHWNFKTFSLSSASAMKGWEEYRIFERELQFKPQKTISAFKQKTTNLAKKVAELNNSIPAKFNKPSVKGRISVLVTQIRFLDMYMHLSNIPEKKVLNTISEINSALTSLQSEFQETVRREQIPTEQGESDLLKMRDTSRAIPTTRTPKFSPRFEQSGIIQ